MDVFIFKQKTLKLTFIAIQTFSDPLYLVDLAEASMSSQYGKFEAASCIDKRMSNLTYMCHTQNQTGPWLKILFKNPAKVEKVQIFNRNTSGFTSKRVDNAEVTLWNEGNKMNFCGSISYIPLSNLSSQSYLIDCGSNQLADTVQIQLPGKGILNLYEVFVLTKTPPAGAASCLKNSGVSSCPFTNVGLEDGDVITVLFFYTTAEKFSISLSDEQGDLPLFFTNYYSETYQYVIGSKTGGAWGTDQKRQKGALLENIMVEVEIKVTATHYKTKINGEALPGNVGISFLLYYW